MLLCVRARKSYTGMDSLMVYFYFLCGCCCVWHYFHCKCFILLISNHIDDVIEVASILTWVGLRFVCVGLWNLGQKSTQRYLLHISSTLMRVYFSSLLFRLCEYANGMLVNDYPITRNRSESNGNRAASASSQQSARATRDTRTRRAQGSSVSAAAAVVVVGVVAVVAVFSRLCHDLDLRTHKTYSQTKGAMMNIAPVRRTHVKHKRNVVGSTRSRARIVGGIACGACVRSEGQPLCIHMVYTMNVLCCEGDVTRQRRPAVTHRSTLFVCTQPMACAAQP